MLADPCTSWPSRSKGSASAARPSARAAHPRAGGPGWTMRELVAAERAPGCHWCASCPRSARRRRGEALAGGVAERVVDLLEAVEVEEHDRDLAGLAVGAGERLAEAVEQQHPVGQTGEVVVVDQMAQVLLAAPLVRDVTACAAVVREASVVVEHRDAAGAQPDVAAGTVPEIFEVMELLTGSDRKVVPLISAASAPGAISSMVSCHNTFRVRHRCVPRRPGRQPDEPVGCIGLPEPIRARGGEVAKPPLAPA